MMQSNNLQAVQSPKLGSCENPALTRMARAFCVPDSSRDNAVLEACTMYSPDVHVGDFIRVDFTQNRISYDGLYLITMGGDTPDWIGIRRFQIVPGGLRIYDGLGDPCRLLPPEQAADIRVLGLIKDVYKKS